MNKGIWLAIGAYGLWGVLPVYWKTIDIVPAPQILSHRIIWSFLFLVIALLVKKGFGVISIGDKIEKDGSNILCRFGIDWGKLADLHLGCKRRVYC